MNSFSRSEKIKLASSIVFIVIAILATTMLLNRQSSLAPTAVDQETARGTESQTSSEQSLVFENYDDMTETLPNISDTLPNQILQQHYDKTFKLERLATITSGIQRKDDRHYSFNIEFNESGTRYTVKILQDPDNIQDYEVVLEEVAS